MNNIYIDSTLPVKNLIDSHFHAIMLQERDFNPHELLQCITSSGFGALLDIGIEANDIEIRKNIVSLFPNVFMTVGLYPSNCEKPDIDDQLSQIRSHAIDNKVIGIGEIGLDFHWNYGTHDLQEDLFKKQLELANQYNLPVCIHTRDAEEDTIRILKTTPPAAGGIIHCFSSGKKAAEKYLDAGMYISFAGNVTYKNATEIKEALAYIPQDRLLFETDAPYLAPQVKRGKPNHPGYIQYIYEFAANERQTKINNLVSEVYENFIRLFNVDLPG